MAFITPDDDGRRLIAMIVDALALADRLGRCEVGIALNEALVCLTGEGIPPPRA